MDTVECVRGVNDCRDKSSATELRIVAIAVILAACVIGVCMPMAGRYVRALRADSNLFFVTKSFAAGVILATAYVHMLPDSFETLSNPCLSENPWAKFPFAGFISMFATLFVLIIDFSATMFYEKKHVSISIASAPHLCKANDMPIYEGISIPSSAEPSKVDDPTQGISYCAENVEARPIVERSKVKVSSTMWVHADPASQAREGDSHVSLAAADSVQLRHRVIAQVLELGIVAHSVIIGITLGTSESPCTIRPLLAALTFHQFFEGIALGSCIAQAGYERRTAAIMGFFFSVTTPLGIAIGMGIASTYNENSPKSLIVQGVFDSVSAGILLYMALVDLIATDFLSRRLRENIHLQIFSYTALFLGAGLMALIAYWA